MNYIKTYTPIEENITWKNTEAVMFTSKEFEDILQKMNIHPYKKRSRDLYPLQIRKEYLRIINEQKQNFRMVRGNDSYNLLFISRVKYWS